MINVIGVVEHRKSDQAWITLSPFSPESEQAIRDAELYGMNQGSVKLDTEGERWGESWDIEFTNPAVLAGNLGRIESSLGSTGCSVLINRIEEQVTPRIPRRKSGNYVTNLVSGVRAKIAAPRAV